MDVILISCGKAKRTYPSEARDLYTGGLFGDARAHAEASGLPWYIVSAKHGLLDPVEWVEPYNKTVKDIEDVPVWALSVWLDLVTSSSELWQIYKGGGLSVELHAGRDYAGPLVRSAREFDERHTTSGLGPVNVHQPLEGLQIGERRAWYKRAREQR